MKRTIHSLMGSSLGLVLAWNNPFVIFTNIVFGWIGGYFPDIDLRFKHRKSFHNIFMITATTIVIYMMVRLLFTNLGDLAKEYAAMYGYHSAISFLLGALMHVFFDMLTPRGVYILWPLSNLRLRIKIFRSSSRVYNGIGLLISLTLFIVWIMIPCGLIKTLS